MMASRDEAPECAGCRLQAGFSFAARFSDSCACVLRVWAGGDMYDGSESDRTTTLTSPPLFSTCRRASRMAGGSYLPANDWCPGHLQRSTLTCSTACRYPPTDCDTLSVCICHAREGKNHTVFYVDRVTAAPSHRRHTGLPPTRALHHMHTMEIDAFGTKTAQPCDFLPRIQLVRVAPHRHRWCSSPGSTVRTHSSTQRTQTHALARLVSF